MTTLTGELGPVGFRRRFSVCFAYFFLISLFVLGLVSKSVFVCFRFLCIWSSVPVQLIT